jgi:hypothetical protein
LKQLKSLQLSLHADDILCGAETGQYSNKSGGAQHMDDMINITEKKVIIL